MFRRICSLTMEENNKQTTKQTNKQTNKHNKKRTSAMRTLCSCPHIFLHASSIWATISTCSHILYPTPPSFFRFFGGEDLQKKTQKTETCVERTFSSSHPNPNPLRSPPPPSIVFAPCAQRGPDKRQDIHSLPPPLPLLSPHTPPFLSDTRPANRPSRC